MENFDLGGRIKDLRVKLGMSQEELAELSGLTGRTVQRIEGGQTVPRGDSLKRIAGALQVDIEELTSQSDGEYHQSETGNEKIQSTTVMPERLYSGAALNPNPRLAAVMIISAFAFFFFPLLGLILPGVIYLLYKNSNPLVKKFGKKILLVESVFCLVLGILYGTLITGGFMRHEMPEMMPFERWLLLLGTGYLINAVAIVVILTRLIKSTKGLWGPIGSSGSLQ